MPLLDSDVRRLLKSAAISPSPAGTRSRTRGAAPGCVATFGDATGLAVKAATNAIPVVSMSEDLVRAKLVSDMRNPGANITGVSVMGTELDAKGLEILAELLAARSTIFLLADPQPIAHIGMGA